MYINMHTYVYDQTRKKLLINNFLYMMINKKIRHTAIILGQLTIEQKC